MKKIFLCAIFQLFLCTVFALAQDTSLPKDRYNVIIVCLDTLRPDHLGCYGYFRETSPNIDKLAANGILFQRAFAQATFTMGSHASLFTSKYVSTHKVTSVERRLGDSETTLAGALKANGYETAAFIYNAPQLSKERGFAQGFDTFFYGFTEKDTKESFEKTLPACLDWLGRNRDKRFFIFLHSNDIHEPYHSTFENFFDPQYKGRLDSEYMASLGTSFHKNNLTRRPREIQHIIAHYDGGIKYADTFVGELMRQLEAWRLLDSTIIILLSDHGEILADRGKQFCHGFSLHDEEVRVPLIIVHPGIKIRGVRLMSQVQLIDVMPTLLDFLGIDRKNMNLEGKSLIGLVEGREEEDLNRYVYAECLKGESEKGDVINREVMVRSSSWKLIASTWKFKKASKTMTSKTVQLHNWSTISTGQKDGYELYNLKEDPKETKNIFNRGYRKIQEELLDKLISAF